MEEAPIIQCRHEFECYAKAPFDKLTVSALKLEQKSNVKFSKGTATITINGNKESNT